MGETKTRRPSFRQIVISTVLVAAAVCLVAGVGVAIRFVLEGTPTASAGEYVLSAFFGLILYGPALVWTAWPVALPAIAAGGLGLAFLRRRQHQPGEERAAMSRAFAIGRVILLCYSAVLVVMWFVWLLGAR